MDKAQYVCVFVLFCFANCWGQWLIEAELFDWISNDCTSPEENQKATNNSCIVSGAALFLSSRIYKNLKDCGSHIAMQVIFR